MSAYKEAYEKVRAIVVEIADQEHVLNEFPNPTEYERQAQNWIKWDEAMLDFWIAARDDLG